MHAKGCRSKRRRCQDAAPNQPAFARVPRRVSGHQQVRKLQRRSESLQLTVFPQQTRAVLRAAPWLQRQVRRHISNAVSTAHNAILKHTHTHTHQYTETRAATVRVASNGAACYVLSRKDFLAHVGPAADAVTNAKRAALRAAGRYRFQDASGGAACS